MAARAATAVAEETRELVDPGRRDDDGSDVAGLLCGINGVVGPSPHDGFRVRWEQAETLQLRCYNLRLGLPKRK